jgi:hypothetical protein
MLKAGGRTQFCGISSVRDGFFARFADTGDADVRKVSSQVLD